MRCSTDFSLEVEGTLHEPTYWSQMLYTSKKWIHLILISRTRRCTKILVFHIEAHLFLSSSITVLTGCLRVFSCIQVLCKVHAYNFQLQNIFDRWMFNSTCQTRISYLYSCPTQVIHKHRRVQTKWNKRILSKNFSVSLTRVIDLESHT